MASIQTRNSFRVACQTVLLNPFQGRAGFAIISITSISYAHIRPIQSGFLMWWWDSMRYWSCHPSHFRLWLTWQKVSFLVGTKNRIGDRQLPHSSLFCRSCCSTVVSMFGFQETHNHLPHTITTIEAEGRLNICAFTTLSILPDDKVVDWSEQRAVRLLTVTHQNGFAAQFQSAC